MLKIIDKPTFEATVKVNTAALKGDFKVTYIAMRNSRLRELQDSAIEAGKGPQGLLPHVVQSFEQVTVDGQAVGTLEELIDWPGVGPAMLQKYFQLLWEEASGN